MIVVDTNLIAYLFINGEHSEEAERVLLRDSRWAAPLLWRSEFRNVLVQSVRRGILEPDEAFRTMTEAETLMSGDEYAVASAEVLNLATSAACSAYDAEFAVLALGLGVPLITRDRALLKSLPKVALAPARFLAL